MLDISYAADKIGLRTLSVEAAMSDLRDHVVLPVIIHCDNHHFIVVYKVTKQKVYVSDPAKGLISYTYEDFQAKWYKEDRIYGFMMALSPMACFKQMEAHEKIERLKSFENILGNVTLYKSAFAIFFVVMLCCYYLKGLITVYFKGCCWYR